MNVLEAVFTVFAVLMLASIVVENRLWHWYVRLCGGAPVGKRNERRAHTRHSFTRR